MFLVYFHRNYDDYTICKILSDDLSEYVKESAAMHVKKCDEMMQKLNIKLKPGSVKSSLSTSNPEELIESKKCQGVCKNDLLLDNLDKFFNTMKKRSTLTVNKPLPKSNNGEVGSSVKVNVDDSGDLVFDMNFKRKRANVQQTPSNQPSTSNNQWHNQRVTENQPPPLRPNYQTNNFTPIETVATNKFNPFNPNGGMKRRTDDPTPNSCFKRPSYVPNQEPDRNEPNAFMPKNDFITATEEMTIQYNRKYGGGNQTDNLPYNTNPNGVLRRSLGGRRTVPTVLNKFVPPFANQDNSAVNSNQANENSPLDEVEMSHPRLKNVEPKMIEAIVNEIIDQCDRVGKWYWKLEWRAMGFCNCVSSY